MKASIMAGRIFVGALFILFSMNAASQALKPADITNREVPVTWLGLDFTEARLIGDIGANESDIKARIVNDINQLIVNEAKKYDIDGALKRSNVSSDLEPTYEANKKMDETKLKSNNADDFKRLDKAKVDQIVGRYHFKDKKGIGVIFIVEAMNKTKDMASFWVTYVDMSTGKVLQTERKEGKAGGFGFRNFWARSAYEVLNDMKKGK